MLNLTVPEGFDHSLPIPFTQSSGWAELIGLVESAQFSMPGVWYNQTL